MTVRLFYPEQLKGNYWGLRDLIQKSEAPDEIASLAKSETFLRSESQPTRYFGRWDVVVISLTQPFYLCLSIFSSAAAFLSYSFGIPSAGRAFTILSKHLTRDWHQLCAQWEFDSALLAPSLNVHRLDTWDLYQWGDFPYEKIEDDMVKPHTFHSTEYLALVNEAVADFYEELEESRYNQSWFAWIWNRGRTVSNRERRGTMTQVLHALQVNQQMAIALLRDKYKRDDLERPVQAFYAGIRYAEARLQAMPAIALFSEKGCCRGGSLWFIYLYQQTKKGFSDSAKHLRAIGEQFAAGMPRQAAILQALDNTDDLLQMRKVEFGNSALSLYELDHNCPSALEKIKHLPLGIYLVGTRNHSLVLIREKEKDFVWDPSFGLYAMSPSELLNWVKAHYHQEGDPNSFVYFDQYHPM